MTFEQSIDALIDVVTQWSCVGELNEFTIVRDVKGRCSLILSAKRILQESELNALQTEARKKLGKYYRDITYCKENHNNDLIKEMIRIAEQYRQFLGEKNGIKGYLLERAIAKKAWVECNFRETAIWPYEAAACGEKPKVITFYSFKGGMGRTTALAAAALGLIKEGKNVLIIDADIEAPGLASLFLGESVVDRGFVDYLLEEQVAEDSFDMSGMLHQITDPVLMEGLSGKLFVIPSGRMDSYYLQKLARIDYQDTIPGNMKRQICSLIGQASEIISQVCKLDYVLLDSRAGFHDMGGVITAQIPHGVVCFGKDSKQSWQGLNLVLRAIGSSQRDRPLMAIVDSAWEQSGVVSAESRKDFKEQAYDICCDSYYDEELQPGLEAEGEAHSPIFVPFYPLLSRNVALYSDGSEIQNEMVRQIKETMLNEHYCQLKDRIESWFGIEKGDHIIG